ncbi:MAG TPA: protein kinase, partial [Nitrospiria bacterium]|nr:protein kinase [Nitrospiria bacterium]
MIHPGGHDELQIRVGFLSETGRREANEDFVGSHVGDARQRAVKGCVVAVADGVGGARGGRQAAEVTVRGFLDGYLGLPDTLGVERAAGRALDAMNRWVFAQGRQDHSLEHMATTFSALVLRGRQAHTIHVGDSRIYRLRDNRLTRLTTDHTHGHPDLRHVLYRAVGIEAILRADYAADGIKLHDRFVLCSDGVHAVLSDRAIQGVLSERTSPQESAERLVRAALDAGSQDNATALVVDVVGLPAADEAEFEGAIDVLPIGDLPKAGELVDGFLLGNVLSSGRYSRLFRAKDTLDGRDVALKFPHPRVAGEASYRRAFVREAWIASRVTSPWIGDVIELPPGRRTRLYSVMPYYEGETLESRLARQPAVSLEEGVRIGIALAKAVYGLNRLRIIHRDVKPDNVLVQPDGGLKLLDLGVARLPGIQDAPSDEIPGTPSFMAPELFAGEAGDDQSDVYALGVTVYRLFSAGAYPYGEVEAFSRPRFTKRTPLTHYRPDLPAWLDAVLAKATAVDKAQRFGDSMEMAFELENGLAQGGQRGSDRVPLYHRNPVRFWQVVSALLALALL